jgi:hypothetical protein
MKINFILPCADVPIRFGNGSVTSHYVTTQLWLLVSDVLTRSFAQKTVTSDGSSLTRQKAKLSAACSVTSPPYINIYPPVMGHWGYTNFSLTQDPSSDAPRSHPAQYLSLARFSPKQQRRFKR